MAGIVNWVKSYIPPAGTVDRSILYLLPFNTLIQRQTDRSRTIATYAAFVLKNGYSGNDKSFLEWMERFIIPSSAREAKNEPAVVLVKSQLHDLICKVTVAAGFYATSHISLYSTLTHLLSHSQKVSNVAQPILERIASMPIPRPLQSARVIAFAPVIVKLIHMALLKADPKGENSVLHLLKKGADKVGQGLEVLWCLRFALISLGISKNLYQSVVSTLFEVTVGHFVTGLVKQIAIIQFLSYLKPEAGEDHQGYKYFLNLLSGGTDILWPTTGFKIGLYGMLSAFFASSAPCDLEVLKTLHTQISEENINYEKTGEIPQIREDIKLNVQNGKISPCFAIELENLMRARGIEACIAMQAFNSQTSNSAFVKNVIEICFPNNSSEEETQFVNTLTSLSEQKISTINEANQALNTLSASIKKGGLKGSAFQSFKNFMAYKINLLSESCTKSAQKTELNNLIVRYTEVFEQFQF